MLCYGSCWQLWALVCWCCVDFKCGYCITSAWGCGCSGGNGCQFWSSEWGCTCGRSGCQFISSSHHLQQKPIPILTSFSTGIHLLYIISLVQKKKFCRSSCKSHPLFEVTAISFHSTDSANFFYGTSSTHPFSSCCFYFLLFLMSLFFLFFNDCLCLSLSSAFFTFHGGAHLLPSVLCSWVHSTIDTRSQSSIFLIYRLLNGPTKIPWMTSEKWCNDYGPFSVDLPMQRTHPSTDSGCWVTIQQFTIFKLLSGILSFFLFLLLSYLCYFTFSNTFHFQVFHILMGAFGLMFFFFFSLSLFSISMGVP